MEKEQINKSTKFANAVLITGIITLLVFFIYVLYKHDLNSHGDIYKYYISSIIGVVILAFALFKISEKLKVGFAIFLTLFVICLYSSEIFLQYYHFYKKNLEIASLSASDNERRVQTLQKITETLGVTFDKRSKYQVLIDLRKEGIDAYPSIVPNLFSTSDRFYSMIEDTFPLGSISDKVTVLCNENGEMITYRSDEHGFRNPSGLYDMDNIDITITGDSYAHGHCVNDGEDIAGWLRKEGRSVLNLGLAGNGPLIEFAVLKEYAEPFKTKFVLWLYYEGNDPMNLRKEQQRTFLMKYLKNEYSQKLLNKQKQIDNMLIKIVEKQLIEKNDRTRQINTEVKEKENIKSEKIRGDLSFSKVIKLWALRSRLGLIEEAGCAFSVDPLFEDIMVRTQSLVNDWGGQLIFVYLPEWSRYKIKRNICQNRYLSSQKSKILSLIKSFNIPVVDIENMLSSYGEIKSLFPLEQIHGNHYNSDGYKLIAQEINKHISSQVAE